MPDYQRVSWFIFPLNSIYIYIFAIAIGCYWSGTNLAREPHLAGLHVDISRTRWMA